MDDNEVPTEGKLVISPAKIRRDVSFGHALMVNTGCLSVASFASAFYLYVMKSAEKLFCFEEFWNRDYTPMTICFMVVLVWWTGFSISLFFINIMLTKAFSEGDYDTVSRWAPNFSIMNALGTNAAVVTGLVFFFTQYCSTGLTPFAFFVFILGIVQAGLSLWVCTLQTPPSDTDWVLVSQDSVLAKSNYSFILK